MKAQALFDVSGEVAVVTGAASGLGLAFSEAMADNGAHVVMVDSNPDTLAKSVADFTARGLSVEGAVADISDHEGITRVIDEAAAKHGHVDAVFANAGMSAGPGYATTTDGAIERTKMETFEKVVAVNLTGTFNTVEAAAAHMKKQHGGHIVITSSDAGVKGQPMCGYAYALTKAAIANLARQAALELAPYNVTVNAIAPGPFITNFAGGRTYNDPASRKAMEDRVPLHRFAKTTEIQGLALLLGSPASSFITGTVISIDGGSTAGG